VEFSNPLRLTHLSDGRKAIIIRTSDRLAFKQCRRKWALSSHLKRNLGSTNLAGPLWFGSAVHFGLEDLHGHNHFGSAADAFRAFCIATSKQHLRDLPGDAKELFDLGTAMLDYYEHTWLTRLGRPPVHPTYIHNGEPQTEANFEIEVPYELSPRLETYARAHGADCVLYRGTVDRVAIDDAGRLWVYEYKTAKRAEHLHYETDPQVTVYMWAIQQVYDLPVAGVVYLQFVKQLPQTPGPLSTGKISTASNLVTSAPLYRRGLENYYGSVDRAPEANQNFLIDLIKKEDENKDRFVQREIITRNEYQLQSEAKKILLELEDVLNPELCLYPNPTRDCSRMCGFLSPCVAMDAGADWEEMLAAKFAERDQTPDTFWRRRLPSPERMKALRGINMTPDLEEMQLRLQELPPADQEAIERGEQEIEFNMLG
jgi:hypothetical protein